MPATAIDSVEPLCCDQEESVLMSCKSLWLQKRYCLRDNISGRCQFESVKQPSYGIACSIPQDQACVYWILCKGQGDITRRYFLLESEPCRMLQPPDLGPHSPSL